MFSPGGLYAGGASRGRHDHRRAHRLVVTGGAGRPRGGPPDASVPNHLKQIGLAAHDFELVFKRFPPGYLSAIPDSWTFSGQGTSSLAFLLPYLELGNIATQADINAASTPSGVSLFDINRVGDSYWLRSDAWTMAQTRIGLFLCPDDDPYTKVNPWMLTGVWCDWPEYATIGGAIANTSTFNLSDTNFAGRTNYVGVAGVYGHDTSNRAAVINRDQGVFGTAPRSTFAISPTARATHSCSANGWEGWATVSSTTPPLPTSAPPWPGWGWRVVDVARLGDPRRRRGAAQRPVHQLPSRAGLFLPC